MNQTYFQLSQKIFMNELKIFLDEPKYFQLSHENIYQVLKIFLDELKMFLSDIKWSQIPPTYALLLI